MSPLVELYVYDLSNGLARQMSRQLMGRQVDGIWHTSVVVFGKEYFYGRGIATTLPGRSHHGQPLQIIPMGETAIDEETWNEYLAQMRQHYTADKYHILEFNCNSFTADCVGFLTGGSIPAYISDLPSDFLASPLGEALAPMINSMSRQPRDGGFATPSTPSIPPTPVSAVPAASNSLVSPIHMCTNPSSMHSILRTHRAVVAFFTSTTCGPCKIIEPVFENLAMDKTKGAAPGSDGRIAFVKIDLDVGLGGSVGGEYGVRVTPTFIFFLDGKKIDELKGVNAVELQSQVNLLLYQAFPPHPHTSLSLPAIEALSLDPILFTQVPALDNVITKFLSFIDASSSTFPRGRIKETLTKSVVPYLKGRFSPANKGGGSLPSATVELLDTWSSMSATLIEHMNVSELFPLVDMWRLAFLDPAVGTWCASRKASEASPDPISAFSKKAIQALNDANSKPRNFMLTLLRLLSNASSSAGLTRRLLFAEGAASHRDQLMELLVQTLLNEDAAVRTAAASLVFNLAACLQRERVERARNDGVGSNEMEDVDWEIEIVSAVIEAIKNETKNEEVVHRLTASLAFLLRLSPAYQSDISPLLEVLQAREVLNAKLEKGGCGEAGVSKKEARKLIEEVAEKLCP